MSGVFILSDGSRLITRLALKENESSVELGFYHWDAAGSTAVSDGLDLGPAWTDDGEERRTTIAGALPIDVSGNNIDPAPMAVMAQGAATALASKIH